MNSKHIEKAVVDLLDSRKYIIVPRVSPMAAGLPFRYELDLIALNSNRYATEIEIKTSISDLKADFKKRFQHDSSLIKYLYFAIPEAILDKAEPLIREAHPGAGIISCKIRESSGFLYVSAGFHRKAKPRKAEQWSDTRTIALLKNLQYKYWSSLHHLRNQKP